jgi:DNA-binding beta-propeller fold protein YncE
MKKLLRKVFILLILIAALTDMSPAAAESRDYIIDDGERIPVPETYILNDIIYYLKDAIDESMFLKLPEDIFVNEQGYIFVADTGNNRIVKLNREGELLEVFKEANGLPFKTPGGVFADKLGNLFIADTGNRRIVHLSATGEFVEEFVSPESELLSDTFLFEPNKICISPTGYIYVLNGKNIMMIDAFNNFRGYIGQSYIGYSITDVLIRIFASDEQKRAVMRRTPSSYINMAIDGKGMIYATTMDYSIGEIKKLNSVGNNILKQYSEAQQSASFLNMDFLTNIQLAGKAFVFGERTDEDGKAFNPVFRDITVDKNGIISVIEENTGKVYQYSDDGDLLAVFGGKSDQKSKFSRPSSLDVDNNGCVYVLERTLEISRFLNRQNL